MVGLLWAVVVCVAIVAIGAFALVLVLARRLRSISERVERFLPISEGTLPDPGTPVPDFTAATVDGRRVSQEDFADDDRLLVFLTTDCGACRDQVHALRGLEEDDWPQPVVVVIGPPEDRADMVSALADRAVLVEEEAYGPIATSFEVHEFPAFLLTGNGVIHKATHGLAKALAAARELATT